MVSTPATGEANWNASGIPVGSERPRRKRQGYQLTKATGITKVSPTEHLAREDVERVLRHRRAAVGEGVGELRGVRRPELDAGEADEEPEEHQPPLTSMETATRTRAASSRRRCTPSPNTSAAWVAGRAGAA